MFALYCTYPLYCRTTDALLGSGGNMVKGYTYETYELAQKVADLETASYDGEVQFSVIHCASGKKVSDLSPYAPAHVEPAGEYLF